MNLKAETGKAHAPPNDPCLQHKEHVVFGIPTLETFNSQRIFEMCITMPTAVASVRSILN